MSDSVYISHMVCEKWRKTGWDDRQPEINALKLKVAAYFNEIADKHREINALKEEREHVYSILRGRTPAQCDLLAAEIAALKAENHGLAELFQKKVDDCAEMEIRMYRENEMLKAENERLRTDAEQLRNELFKANCSLNAQLSNSFEQPYQTPSAAMSALPDTKGE